MRVLYLFSRYNFENFDIGLTVTTLSSLKNSPFFGPPCIIINDKSQCSVAKYLKCNGLLYDKFIMQLAGERIFRTVEHLSKLRAKWLIVSCAPFALQFRPQKQNSPDK